jgi:hypothetical protein
MAASLLVVWKPSGILKFLMQDLQTLAWIYWDHHRGATGCLLSLMTGEAAELLPIFWLGAMAVLSATAAYVA